MLVKVTEKLGVGLTIRHRVRTHLRSAPAWVLSSALRLTRAESSVCSREHGGCPVPQAPYSAFTERQPLLGFREIAKDSNPR